MKNFNPIILLACLLFLVSCSRKNPVAIRKLTKEKFESINKDKTIVKCEQFIEGTFRYEEIIDIEHRKLSK